MSNRGPTLRIDRWLWAARLYKSRGLATTAVLGGKVRLNGKRSRPAHPVRAGDRIAFTKGVYEFEITILDISLHRGPAREAARLYEESDVSVEKRKKLKAQMAMERAIRQRPQRPDKRQRRQLRQLSRGRD